MAGARTPIKDRSVEVALPLPLQSTFTYRVPAGFATPHRGARVLVPFGRKRVIGVVTGGGDSRGRSLKDVTEVIDETPLVEPPLVDLAGWMADYYLAPPGECFRLVFPPSGARVSRRVVRLLPSSELSTGEDPLVEALRDGPLSLAALTRRLGRDPAARISRLKREGVVGFEEQLPALRRGARSVRVARLVGLQATPRGAAEAQVLERLREAEGQLRVPDLVRGRSALRGALKRLVAKGVVAVTDEVARAGNNGATPSQAPQPSSDQQRVLETLLSAVSQGGYRPFLLHGITGSGKTEVYLRAAQRALELGKSVLLLVPEISLTPHLVRAATARFGGVVCVLHSQLSLGERHDAWWRIREAEARVVVGARSAVFAPLPDLGLLVVDEEHDGAYKQEEIPRYHGRDVAVLRAKLEGAALVLGSATPSMETYANALKGKYTRLTLPERIAPGGLPRVTLVDRRQVLKAGGDPILSPLLLAALRERVERKDQALLLLNRRGYATSLLCRECGEEAVCPNCSVSLTLHEGGKTLECHYCGHRSRAESDCSACGGEYLRLRGYGTERVVEAVRQAIPTARVDRLDRDRTSRRGALESVLGAFESGEIDILVGTQMIAKGHDFPRVTLVGVVDADVGLGLPDFRSAERIFQLLTQVAGRAGRADRPGDVILQSAIPDHYALRLAWAQDYEGFFEREMEFRRGMGYPPSVCLVNLVVRSSKANEAAGHAEALARLLRARPAPRYRVLGPAQAPLARLKREHRFQVLLKGDRTAMRESVRSVLRERFGDIRWPDVTVDVDPVSLM